MVSEQSAVRPSRRSRLGFDRLACDRRDRRRAPRSHPGGPSERQSARLGGGCAPGPDRPRHRLHPGDLALGEGGRHPHLHARLRLSPDALLPGRHRRGARRCPAPRQRRRQHRRRSHRRARGRARSAAWRGARGPSDPPILVRTDSAGATHAFLEAVVEMECSFSVGCDLAAPVRAAILATSERAWAPAVRQNGAEREGAFVAELDLVLAGWPEGSRAICRRERPHPGARSPSTMPTATASRCC